MPTFSIPMDDMRMSQLSPRKIQFFTSSGRSRPSRRLLDGAARDRLACVRVRRRQQQLISFPGNFSLPRVRVWCNRLASDGSKQSNGFEILY